MRHFLKKPTAYLVCPVRTPTCYFPPNPKLRSKVHKQMQRKSGSLKAGLLSAKVRSLEGEFGKTAPSWPSALGRSLSEHRWKPHGLAIPAGVPASLLETPALLAHISGQLRAGSLIPEPPYFRQASFRFDQTGNHGLLRVGPRITLRSPRDRMGTSLPRCSFRQENRNAL